MAEEETPVFYEDLAKLESEFDEIDTEISSYMHLVSLKPVLTSN